MDTECFWLFPVETWWPLENLLWQLLCRSKSSLPLSFLTAPFAAACLVALSLAHQESLERAALGPWQFLVQNGLGPLDFCLFCRVMGSASYGALVGLGLSFYHVGPGILRSFRSVWDSWTFNVELVSYLRCIKAHTCNLREAEAEALYVLPNIILRTQWSSHLFFPTYHLTKLITN